MNQMKIYDDGWYFIRGISSGKRVCHYFFNDKIIHDIFVRGCSNETKFTIMRSCPDISKAKPCKICLSIIVAWQKVGLENRDN